MHAELRWCIFRLNNVIRRDRMIAVLYPRISHSRIQPEMKFNTWRKRCKRFTRMDSSGSKTWCAFAAWQPLFTPYHFRISCFRPEPGSACDEARTASWKLTPLLNLDTALESIHRHAPHHTSLCFMFCCRSPAVETRLCCCPR